MAGNYNIASKKLIIPPVAPAVGTAVLPASTMFDMVMGVDVHIVNIPSPGGPIPTPLPHPAIGIIFDPTLMLPPISIPVPYALAAPVMNAIAAASKAVEPVTSVLNQNVFAMAAGQSPPPPPPPEPPPPPDPDAPPPPDPPTFMNIPTGVGASVLINSMARTNVTTKYKQIPPHIPMGAGFTVPSNIKNGGHAFMGSLTVNVEGNPFTFAVLPCTSCQCIGKPDKEDGGMSLPTTIITPLPKGPLVLVGGPPVPVLTIGSILKGGMKFLKKLMKKSAFMKRVSNKLHSIFNAKAGSWKSKAICFFTGHPVDVGSGYFHTSRTDFELPGPIPFKWEREYYSRSKYDGPLGYGWHHCYDLFIQFYEKENGIGLKLADGRMVALPELNIGDDPYFEQNEKFDWFRDEKGYGFTNKEKLTYRFAYAGGESDVYRLVSIENTSGHAIKFEYTNFGFLKLITDSADRLLEVTTDFKGRIFSVSHKTEFSKDKVIFIQYRFDENSNLIEAIDALNQPQRFYYVGHLIVRETDRNGLSFYFEYDGYDTEARCIKTWGDNDIYYRKLTYYEGLTVVEDLSGNRTEYHHDDGVVYKTVDPKGGISLTVRNETGDIIQETDEEGLTTTYSYDERGNRLGTVNPDGSAVSYTYENDIAIGATDAGGGNWIWIRNEEGKVVQQINPIGLITQYEYTNGLLTAVIRNDGARTEILYDQQFNVAELRLPDGNSSSWTFDALGRCIEYTDVYGGTQFRRFDNLGRVIEITEVDGNRIFFKYNGEGEVIHVKDKLREVEFEYQGMGKMAQRKENNTKLEFIYDKEEQLIGIRNEKGTPYNFKLDPLGNVTEEIGFDGIKRRFARDKAGKVTSVQRPDNKITKYEYDDGGRITKVIQYDDLTELFTYDLAGNLVEAANDNILLKFERDKLGRVKKETQGDFIIESLFDDKGTRVGLKSSAGADIRIDRSVMGDVSAMSASNGDSTWEAKLQYDEMGLEVLRELPGGLQSRWQRDKLGRPLEHVVTKGKTLHRSRQYLWDYDDRLKKMIDQVQGETQFGHDAVGNLTWAKYNDGFIEYRIADETGNYYKTKDKSDRKFGPAGQILESKNTKFEYDAEGNLIKKLLKDGKEWRYQWYSNGMLKKVIRPDKKEVSFTYDPLGRRLSKTFQDKTTNWVWDGNLPLHEWSEESSQQHLEVSVKGELEKSTAPEDIITWVFQPESFAPVAKLLNGEAFSIVSDHLGTPAEMYNGKGDKVWEVNLNIYGQIRNIEGYAADCPFRYPGQYEDEETGLYYNRFRYYDAEEGFYVSQDPIGLVGGIKLYAYVDNTHTFVDIFGFIKAPASVPNEPGIYTLTNDTTGEAYVGSGIDVNSRMSDSNHTKAQALLGHPDTNVQFTPVDIGTAQNPDTNRVLRHFEQQEYDRVSALGYEMQNSNNPEASKKRKRNEGIVKAQNAKKKRRRSCK